jgi:hypothetical protein
MIEIDPRLYLPDDYIVTWTCPSCARSVPIKLGHLDTAQCQDCAQLLSPDDIESLEAFRRLIA